MNFHQEVRYAARQLAKNQGFTAAAVLTLALGIGANLTVFLILYGVWLRPLPFPQAREIVRVNRFYRNAGLVPPYTGTNFLFMERASRTLDSAAAYDFVPRHVNLVEGGEAVPLEALRVTSDFFRVFEMPPQIGRGFTLEDMVPNASEVAVVSDALWRQRFSADPHVLGRAITLVSICCSWLFLP